MINPVRHRESYPEPSEIYEKKKMELVPSPSGRDIPDKAITYANYCCLTTVRLAPVSRMFVPYLLPVALICEKGIYLLSY